MRRREFIALVGSLVTVPRVVEAQQVKIRRIGILSPESPPVGLLRLFDGGFASLGTSKGIGLHLRSGARKDMANSWRRSPINWWSSRST
jgi:hypothetical protein